MCTSHKFHDSKDTRWDVPGGPIVKNLPSNAGDVGSIPGWGTRSCMRQLRSPHAATKKPTCPN